MPRQVLIRRTSTPNNPPPSGLLLPGELSVEMGVPLRLWVGVPATDDPTMRKLIIDASAPPGGVTSFNGRGGAVTLSPADVAGATGLLTTGGTMTGKLNLSGDAVLAMEAVTFQQMQGMITGGKPEPIGPGLWGRLETAVWARAVAVSGDTMTGALTLPGDAVNQLEAVPLRQLQASIAAIPAPTPPDLTPYVVRTGDAMTGFLGLVGDATAALHAVPLQQLTAAIAAIPPTITEPVGAGTWGRLSTAAWQRSVAVAGDTMTGNLTVQGHTTVITLDVMAFGINYPTLGLGQLGFGFETPHLAAYADGVRIGRLVRLEGDTMTGKLVLSGDATQPLEAVAYRQLTALQTWPWVRTQGGLWGPRDMNVTYTNPYAKTIFISIIVASTSVNDLEVTLLVNGLVIAADTMNRTTTSGGVVTTRSSTLFAAVPAGATYRLSGPTGTGLGIRDWHETQ